MTTRELIALDSAYIDQIDAYKTLFEIEGYDTSVKLCRALPLSFELTHAFEVVFGLLLLDVLDE